MLTKYEQKHLLIIKTMFNNFGVEMGRQAANRWIAKAGNDRAVRERRKQACSGLYGTTLEKPDGQVRAKADRAS